MSGQDAGFKLMAVRFSEAQWNKIELMMEISGWNCSEVVRRLVESAVIVPPRVKTDLLSKDIPSPRMVRGRDEHGRYMGKGTSRRYSPELDEKEIA